MLLRRPWRSLRIKIIASSFIPTIIIMLAAALVSFYAYQRVAEDLVLGRNQELARLSAGQLSSVMAEYTDLLEALARTADMRNDDPVARGQALRRAANRLVVFDGGALVINRYGRVIAAEPARPEVIDQNWSNRPYYWQMLRSEVPVFSDVLPDGPGGADVVVVAVPLLGDQGEFRGTLAGMFRLGAESVSALYGSIVKLRIGESGSTYLVDGKGRVIFHSNPDLIGSDLSSRDLVGQLAGRKSGQQFVSDGNGQRLVASFAPVPGTSWGLVTEESWDALMSPSQGYRLFLLALLALGVVVPALVVTFAVRRVTGPVAELIAASRGVAGGDFGQTITVTTGDELEELAGQFNTMSAQLKESYSDLERKVADRTRELATLNAIAAAVSGSLELEEILPDALGKTIHTMGIEAGGIYLLDEREAVLRLVAHVGLSQQFVTAVDGLRMGEGFSGRVVETGDPLVVQDVSSDPRFPAGVPLDEAHSSLAAVPVVSRGRTLGAIFVATRRARQFTPQDVQLLSSIGHQIGVGVENAHLFRAERRRAEQFRLIGEVGHRITSILAVDGLLWEIVRLVRETLGYRMVQIGLIEGDEVVIKTGAGSRWEKPDVRTPRLKVGSQGIIGWVAYSGEPLLANDVSREPRYYHVADSADTRSELAVPLKTHETIIGVLDVQSDHVDGFDSSDLAVLQSLAHQAAVAIENARLYERAQQLAVLEERNRLARDLHDSVTQAVYGVTLYAEAATRLLTAGQVETATRHLLELRSTAQQALREMRSLIFELRPPDLEKDGLVAALQARLESVEGRTGLEAVLAVDGEVVLPMSIQKELYRIAQEALNNALHHAQARRVRVHLERAGRRVALEVADDGVGFEPTAAIGRGGMGLRGMAERADGIGGRLEVRSCPGEGTTVRVEVYV